METTKNYLSMKLLVVASFVFYSISAISKDIDSAAAASTLTDDQKFAEIINYVAMGVGTVAVIWIAYFLSNRSSGTRTPKPRIKVR